MSSNFHQDINKEWENFVCSNYKNLLSDDDDVEDDFDDENINNVEKMLQPILNNIILNNETPKATDIYISTKTKIAYLNRSIDLNIFWKIPVISYAKPLNGIIKKQIKINCLDMDELIELQEKLKQEKHYDEHIITSINNPSGRIKFKDIRKISIGLCKKDIMSYRCKKKSAFYNCFVLILRLKIKDIFKEFHVKVFNTGKLEIPGIQNDHVFIMILDYVKNILQPHVDTGLFYKEELCETVLINSNFNCGFFINREIFYDILKMKYDIQAIYDPCSYPGIQCKFYYNPDLGIQTGSQISEQNKDLYKNVKKVSFMIFRTGSILIVGKCDEEVLKIIYQFLIEILNTEYKNIAQKILNPCIENEKISYLKDKKKKIRKKNIMVSQETIIM
jgi:TATA-box binding protein (TBP) (component of TFIID and TFIIIB)